MIEFLSAFWHNPRVQVTFEFTQKDFFQSYVAHRKRSAVSKWSFRLLASLVFTLAVLFTVAAGTTHPAFSNVAMAVLSWGYWALLLWGLPWWFARRQFQNHPMAHGARKIVADADGLHVAWTGGSANMNWSNLVRYIEAKNQFLLYTSPACFNIIPKRALTPEQLSDFRSLLQERILPCSKRAAAAHN